jgi:lipoprotein NlpD
MRTKKIRLVLLGVLAGALAACSTTTTRAPAPVVDRATPAKTTEAVKPHVITRGNYLVKKGDTLYRIALEHGQNYRDIVAWNNLTNANDIKVDQILRVLPPETNTEGAQTGSVSPSGVEVRALSSSAGAVSATNANNTGSKTMPRGDKRAYTDGTLAEMQKTDAVAPAVTVANVAKPAESKAGEKTAEPSAGNEDGIAWMWPATGKVIATFDDGKSKGIDIAGKLGQQVVAAGSGKVMYAGSGIRGYGNLVIVKHTSSLLSAYAHNKSIVVREGESVSKGQKIAEMGNSDADAVKLHFEIRQQGKPVDPSKFLPNR